MKLNYSVILFALSVILVFASWVTAQEETMPPSPPSETATPSLTLTNTATLTETPTPTPTLTTTITETPTSETTELVVEATATPSETLTAAVEITAELTAEVTLEIGATASPTASPTPSETLTPSPETTELPTSTDTPTATLVIPLAAFTSVARYQNRQPDNSGIQVEILNGERQVLYATITDGNGVYSVLAPTEAFFWLVIRAPLHKSFELGIWPGEMLPEVTLRGGDLNADGCIDAADITLLKTQYEVITPSTGDITGDGIVETADLAILAGNYDPTLCELPSLLDPTDTATPVPSTQLAPLPIEVTDEVISTPEATVEIGGD